MNAGKVSLNEFLLSEQLSKVNQVNMDEKDNNFIVISEIKVTGFVIHLI